MAVVTGTIRCKRCFRNFEWYCVIDSTNEDVSEIGAGKVAARRVPSKDEGKPDMIQVRCKHCAETNRFEYKAP